MTDGLRHGCGRLSSVGSLAVSVAGSPDCGDTVDRRNSECVCRVAVHRHHCTIQSPSLSVIAVIIVHCLLRAASDSIIVTDVTPTRSLSATVDSRLRLGFSIITKDSGVVLEYHHLVYYPRRQQNIIGLYDKHKNSTYTKTRIHLNRH